MKRFFADFGLTVGYNFCVFISAMILFSVFMRLDILQSIVTIYFFRLVIYIVISSVVVAAAILVIITAKKNVKLLCFIDNKLVLSGFVISILLIYAFMSLVPFASNRSYTIFSLAYLYENSDKSFSTDEMEQIFITGFVIEFGATEYRINEQLTTGYINMDPDGRYRISKEGKRFIELLRFIDIFYPTSANPSSLYPNGNPDRPLIN